MTLTINKSRTDSMGMGKVSIESTPGYNRECLDKEKTRELQEYFVSQQEITY